MSTKDISDLQVLEACRDWPAAVTFADLLLAARHQQHPKVAFRALERAARRGLIEYGVSLRTAWVTAAGAELLQQHGRPTERQRAEPNGDGCIGLQVLCSTGGELRQAWYQPVRMELWREHRERPGFTLMLQTDLRMLLGPDDLQVLAMAPYTLPAEQPTV